MHILLIKENVRANIRWIIFIPSKHLIERLRIIMLLPRLYLMPMRVGGNNIVKRFIFFIL